MSAGREARDPAVEPDPELERVLSALEQPPARPAFRAALRERFLAGAAPDDVGRYAARAPDPSPARRNLVFLAGALAAAAAVVLTVFLARPRAPVWRVLDGTSATSLLVDGLALRLDEGQRAAQALLAARELELAAGTLRLAVRDEAWIELGPGTRLTQMKFAAAGQYQLKVERGSLRVATLDGFGRRGLRVVTGDLEVVVAGTIFGVDVDAQGSCVCVAEGRVMCAPARPEPARAVEAGELGFAPRDGGAAAWHAAEPEHLAPLRALAAARDADEGRGRAR